MPAMEWQPPIDEAALSKGIYSQGAEEGMLDRVLELVAPRRRLRFVGTNTFVTGRPYRYGPGEAL